MFEHDGLRGRVGRPGRRVNQAHPMTSIAPPALIRSAPAESNTPIRTSHGNAARRFSIRAASARAWFAAALALCMFAILPCAAAADTDLLRRGREIEANLEAYPKQSLTEIEEVLPQTR